MLYFLKLEYGEKSLKNDFNFTQVEIKVFANVKQSRSEFSRLVIWRKVVRIGFAIRDMGIVQIIKIGLYFRTGQSHIKVKKPFKIFERIYLPIYCLNGFLQLVTVYAKDKYAVRDIEDVLYGLQCLKGK